ncbi:MAG: hypothetical protein CMC13_14815 [Flavobacteriaceae bacterium]|nr:hypothetical protein [Flavobacteriaceae bacterium]|tara:strand:+ start:3505 stop:4080 length:576 start_codon:yes stop_codon:yes gene_type:complete
MKTILILTNKDGRGKIIETERSLAQEKEFDDVKVFVMSDNCELSDITARCGAETPPDYFAYHITAKDKGKTRVDFNDEYFTNTMIKGFSHEEDAKFPDNFYNKVLPKIYLPEQDQLTLADIERYFPSTLESTLNLLHDIDYGKGKDDLEKRYGELLKESKCKYVFDTFFDNDNEENFVAMRDKLITYATQH